MIFYWILSGGGGCHRLIFFLVRRYVIIFTGTPENQFKLRSTMSHPERSRRVKARRTELCFCWLRLRSVNAFWNL